MSQVIPTRFETITTNTDLKPGMVGVQIGAAGTLGVIMLDGTAASLTVVAGQWWGRVKQITAAPANSLVMYL